MNTQSILKELTALRDAHGDVCLPISRVMDMVSGISNQETPKLKIDRDKLAEIVGRAIVDAFESGNHLDNLDFSLYSGNRIELSSADLDSTFVETEAKKGIDEYLDELEEEQEEAEENAENEA